MHKITSFVSHSRGRSTSSIPQDSNTSSSSNTSSTRSRSRFRNSYTANSSDSAALSRATSRTSEAPNSPQRRLRRSSSQVSVSRESIQQAVERHMPRHVYNSCFANENNASKTSLPDYQSAIAESSVPTNYHTDTKLSKIGTADSLDKRWASHFYTQLTKARSAGGRGLSDIHALHFMLLAVRPHWPKVNLKEFNELIYLNLKDEVNEILNFVAHERTEIPNNYAGTTANATKDLFKAPKASEENLERVQTVYDWGMLRFSGDITKTLTAVLSHWPNLTCPEHFYQLTALDLISEHENILNYMAFYLGKQSDKSVDSQAKKLILKAFAADVD